MESQTNQRKMVSLINSRGLGMRHITSPIGSQQPCLMRSCVALTLPLLIAVSGCQQSPLKVEPAQAQKAPQIQISTANEASRKNREDLIREATAIAATTQQAVTLDWLAGVQYLPSVATRTLYRNKAARTWLTQTEYDSSGLKVEEVNTVPFDEKGYYGTFYGTPIAYTLVLDIIGQLGYRSLNGLKVADYGYGAVGTVRLSAAAGAQVVGLDVDPMLDKLYNQNQDQGLITDRQTSAQRTGRVTLIHQPFPNDAKAAEAAAQSDVIISKNTLKKGFVRPATGKAMIDLGMPAQQYLAGFAKALKPGGYLVIYNISQRLDPSNYRPANDGASPFSRDEYEAAGLKVVFFEQSDNDKVRRLGEALGWGGPQGMGDLNTNLFAQYTVVQRPSLTKAQ
jgi:SAM-dependent methyltransferase